MICGQSDTEANLLPDLYGFGWIQFQMNHFCFLEKYADFVHRQGTTDYNSIRHMDQILGGTGIIITLSRPKSMVAYAFISSRFRPSFTGVAQLR